MIDIDVSFSEAVRRAKEEVSTEASAVESERSSLLFTLKMEQYTCVMRNEAILRFVGERVIIMKSLDRSSTRRRQR